MSATDAAKKIAALLDARSAKARNAEHWVGLVFTHRGARVLECLHQHGGHVGAKRCAEKLIARYARLEAGRGVRP